MAALASTGSVSRENNSRSARGCTGLCSELVFNLDEVGISDWEDRKTKKVIALAAMFGHTIQHGVSRNVKHISVIACL
jgi:hypothetical protein